MKSTKILITGGSGFIGGHLLEALARGKKNCSIHVIDRRIDTVQLEKWKIVRSLLFEKWDLRKITDGDLERNYDIVFHFAADPDVRRGSVDPKSHMEHNIMATYNLLEALRKSGTKLLVFASTSTVYGEPEVLPTPESYGPLKPISVYGASKLACESLISAYAGTYGFRAIIYRLANIVGPGSSHGVINDFFIKLRRNQKELEILGDGTQKKSYLYISDCIEAIFVGLKQASSRVEIFNVGSEDQIEVLDIANIICEEMGLHKVKYRMKRIAPEGRGWVGDVKTMLLDVSKLKKLGWKPRLNSEDAVRRTVRELISIEQSVN